MVLLGTDWISWVKNQQLYDCPDLSDLRSWKVMWYFFAGGRQKSGHVPKNLLGLQVLILGAYLLGSCWESEIWRTWGPWEAAASSSRAGEGGRNYEFYGRFEIWKASALGQKLC